MYWNELLRRSREHWEQAPGYAAGIRSHRIFSVGAMWMAVQLPAGGNRVKGLHTIPFGLYGLLKYGASLLAGLLSVALLLRLHPALTPLSVLAFYLVEIHFLFLFPLLIDGVASPLLTSIREPYRRGLLRSLVTVMPIAAFMLAGLLRFRRPLYNWHLGCIAVLIWYRDAFADRK